MGRRMKPGFFFWAHWATFMTTMVFLGVALHWLHSLGWSDWRLASIAFPAGLGLWVTSILWWRSFAARMGHPLEEGIDD